MSKKLRLLAISAAAIIPAMGVVSLAGVAGAASGVHGSATLAGDKIVLTSWSLVAGAGGLHATGTTTPNTLAATISGNATASGTNFNVSNVTVTIPAASCTVTIPSLTLTKAGTNHYTGSTTIVTSDYGSGCTPKLTGPATVSLTP